MDIIFDFDGVIINSHKVKSHAFYNLFKNYGNNIALKAKRYHENNIGKSRYFKFRFIAKNFLNKKLTKRELLRLDKSFDFFVEKKIKKMMPSKYLLKFLDSKKKLHNFYISTGTPQKKIIKILKDKKLSYFFKKIYGSPTSKITHIKKIKKRDIKILFIGDSFDDYKVAKKTDINFILKLNSENLLFRNKINVKKINSFKYLNKYVDFLQS